MAARTRRVKLEFVSVGEEMNNTFKVFRAGKFRSIALIRQMENGNVLVCWNATKELDLFRNFAEFLDDVVDYEDRLSV